MKAGNDEQIFLRLSSLILLGAEILILFLHIIQPSSFSSLLVCLVPPCTRPDHTLSFPFHFSMTNSVPTDGQHTPNNGLRQSNAQPQRFDLNVWTPIHPGFKTSDDDWTRTTPNTREAHLRGSPYAKRTTVRSPLETTLSQANGGRAQCGRLRSLGDQCRGQTDRRRQEVRKSKFKRHVIEVQRM